LRVNYEQDLPEGTYEQELVKKFKRRALPVKGKLKHVRFSSELINNENEGRTSKT
jgi:hypothetical protein